MNDVMIAYFLSLVRSKSYTATAEQMFTAKQVISKTIKTMESELGFPLFLRGSHSVALTAEGKQLAELLTDYDRRYFAASSSLRRYSDRRDIWLAVEEWVGLSPEITRALNAYEKMTGCPIRIRRVRNGKAMGMLLADNVDGAITSNYCAAPVASLCRITALEERGMCVDIAANHPLSMQMETQALETLPFFAVYSGEHSQEEVYGRVNRLFSELGYTTPQIQIKQGLAEVYAEILLRNGFSILPERVVSDEILQVPLLRTVSVVFASLKKAVSPETANLETYLKKTVGGAEA